MTYDRSMSEPVASTGTFTGLREGCPVYTADNDKVGEVKEIRAGAFKVNAAMQPDYWLSTSAITSATTDRVTLSFPKDRLGSYKLDNPVQG